MLHAILSPTSPRRLRCAAPRRHRQRGFSLLEALVSVVVLSFGLLGVAGLQAAALKYSRDAGNQSIAVNLAREMAEMIRSNARVSGEADNPYLLDEQDASGNAPSGAGAIGPFTDGTGATPGTALADAQVADWKSRVGAALPGARVAVCKDSAPYDASGDYVGAPHWACNGSGDIIVIKIGWEREDTAGAIQAARDVRPFVVLPVTPAGQQ